MPLPLSGQSYRDATEAPTLTGGAGQEEGEGGGGAEEEGDEVEEDGVGYRETVEPTSAEEATAAAAAAVTAATTATATATTATATATATRATTRSTSASPLPPPPPADGAAFGGVDDYDNRDDGTGDAAAMGGPSDIWPPFPMPNRGGVERFIKSPLTEVGLSGLVTLSCLLFTLQTLDGNAGGVPGGMDLGDAALDFIDKTEYGIGLVFFAEYLLRWYYQVGVQMHWGGRRGLRSGSNRSTSSSKQQAAVAVATC